MGQDGTVSSGSPNLTSAHANCAVGDVGKAVSVTGSSNAFLVPTGAVTTVLSCSGSAWVMSANATGSLAGTAVWGIAWDAAAGLQAAYTAAFSTGLQAGQTLALPCGTMALSAPPFVSPATYAPFLQSPDIQGCNGTLGTNFILLPTIASGLSCRQHYLCSCHRNGYYRSLGLLRRCGQP